MFAGLTAYGKAAGAVSSRFQSALHIFTDSEIFVLHAIANVH